MGHFWVQNGPFVPNKKFCGKIIVLIFIYLLIPSLGKILKNSYNGSRVKRMCHFWTQNGPICPHNFFKRKPVNKPCSYYSCLSTFKKIKFRCQYINEILIIKEYWYLIGQETLLAITWEPNFSQTCSFCRMLKGNKKFRFKLIQAKLMTF